MSVQVERVHPQVQLGRNNVDKRPAYVVRHSLPSRDETHVDEIDAANLRELNNLRKLN